MNLMRETVAFAREMAHIGVMVAGFVVLSGCAQSPATGSNHDDSKGREPSAGHNGSGSASQPFHLPIEDYSISPDDSHLIEKAKSVLISQCMSELGSDYVEPIPTKLASQASRRYGISDLATAGQWGYHMPKNAITQTNGGFKKLTEKDRTLLFGIDGTNKRSTADEKLPAGGCVGEANSTIAGEHVPDSAIAFAQNVDVASFKALQKDASFIEVSKRWSKCMSRDGYTYYSPLMAVSDSKFHEVSEVTEHEKKVAKTDMQCKLETELMDEWSEIEGREQKRMINERLDKLRELKDFQEREIETARKVLSDSS